MRIALLADVHGNHVALQTVLEDMALDAVDCCWFLGDAVGYGPRPRHCLQELARLVDADQPWLAGNHDRGVGYLVDGAACEDGKLRSIMDDGEACEVARYHASELRDWRDHSWYTRMVTAPTWIIENAISDKTIAVAHGTVLGPADSDQNIAGPNSYLRQIHQARSAFIMLRHEMDVSKCRLLCVGHTHVPRLFMAETPDVLGPWSEFRPPEPDRLDLRSEITVTLEDEATRLHSAVVCPGSVGQPRGALNGRPDPRAGYAVLTWNDRSKSVSFRRVPYNIREVQRQMREDGYPDFTIGRLALGQ